MKLLFVCTGNTCRSPMAQEIAKKVLAEKGIDAKVSSAGIYAFMGTSASENSLKVMEEIGLDLSNHMASLLDRKMLEENDIILTMTQGHKESIISSAPDFKDKIYTFGEYIGIGKDIIDPFGGSVDVYRSCRQQLEDYTYKLLEII
ncbi:low molecular weight protein arginine phosphatase [Clostridium cylindrosporum]|uniref:Protein-arginine-phosphatase YwlE n=1 Tax=Clostridium cylindrosporum DSM 605 TaxID=1121307 RepID=A0A0J8G554_CLOCY|nr:low molecular weight protein arginine phosphatase [Clostridium cylindrosporum]KMT22796.1 protein-arginine-phosphatase YwlE [Clostridium cylindrosporum DSM 605]